MPKVVAWPLSAASCDNPECYPSVVLGFFKTEILILYSRSHPLNSCLTFPSRRCSFPGRRGLHVNRSGVGCRQLRQLFLKVPAAHLCMCQFGFHLCYLPVLIVDSSVPFSAEGLQQMAAPVSILDLSEDANGARFGGAACSSQPVRMITVNSLEFPIPLWRAAISLKPSFKPLIVLLREFKEPMEVHSHSRLKRIITPLRQFWTSASDTPGDYYYATMSRPRAWQRP